VLRIERDNRAPVRVPAAVAGGGTRERHPVLKRLLGRALDLDVDRQPDRATGIGIDGRLELAVRVAERVDPELGLARAPSQVTVVGRLDARLADLVSRLIAGGRVLELLLRDLADVAEQLSSDGALGVVA